MTAVRHVQINPVPARETVVRAPRSERDGALVHRLQRVQQSHFGSQILNLRLGILICKLNWRVVNSPIADLDLHCGILV